MSSKRPPHLQDLFRYPTCWENFLGKVTDDGKSVILGKWNGCIVTICSFGKIHMSDKPCKCKKRESLNV